MHPKHLYSVDLRLLLALDALLEERSVTRAGRRLGLTQSATSRVLGRLRVTFGDALLVRTGRDLVPTPRAEALRQPLRDALLGLNAVVAEPPSFDPTTARRTFTLATTDYGAAIAVSPILGQLSRQAPGVDLVVNPQDDRWEALSTGALDAAIFPRRRSAPGVVWTNLFAEEFVCLVRRNHPSVRGVLSLKQFSELPHLFVSPTGAARGVVDQALARRGLSRRIALRIQSFLVAPLVVAESDLIALVPKRVAVQQAARLPLQLLPPPLELPGFSVALAWHERMRADPGHAWLRRLIVSVTRPL